MNVNGNNKDCESCKAAVELGTNRLGMKLYGCVLKSSTACKDMTILEELEIVRREKDSDRTGKEG